MKKSDQHIINNKESNGDVRGVYSKPSSEAVKSKSPLPNSKSKQSSNSTSKTQDVYQQNSSNSKHSISEPKTSKNREETRVCDKRKNSKRDKQQKRSSRELIQESSRQSQVDSLPQISSRSTKTESTKKESPQKRLSSHKSAELQTQRKEHLPVLTTEESSNHSGKVEYAWKTPKSTSAIPNLVEENSSKSPKRKQRSKGEKLNRNNQHSKEEQGDAVISAKGTKIEQVSSATVIALLVVLLVNYCWSCVLIIVTFQKSRISFFFNRDFLLIMLLIIALLNASTAIYVNSCVTRSLDYKALMKTSCLKQQSLKKLWKLNKKCQTFVSFSC